MAANLLTIDRNLASMVMFKMGGEKKTPILFQFPPKILSDSRGAKWDEVELPGSQPIQIWATSGARKWTLEWTYIVGASAGWDVFKVRDQITKLRNYYTMNENLATNFVVTFQIWLLGGDNPTTCRLGNIEITHGKALYIPYVKGEAGIALDMRYAHPVVTNIKVGMQLWTGGGTLSTGKGEAGSYEEAIRKRKSELKESGIAEAAGKIDLKDLVPDVPIDWQ